MKLGGLSLLSLLCLVGFFTAHAQYWGNQAGYYGSGGGGGFGGGGFLALIGLIFIIIIIFGSGANNNNNVPTIAFYNSSTLTG